MQNLFGEIAGQSDLCACWLKEIVEELMMNDRARPKNKLKVAKYRKRVQMSSEMVVMFDPLQIIN